jgi:hypothetical protein
MNELDSLRCCGSSFLVFYKLTCNYNFTFTTYDDQDRKDFENLEESGREPETYSCGEDQDLTKGLPEFSLVKLARMGMVYLSVSGRTSRDMVTVLSRLLADIHAGLRTSPK